MSARSSRRFAAPAPRWLWLSRLPVHLALLATIVFFGAPFLYVLAAAFERRSRPTLHNFAALFRDLGFAVPLRNSLFVATATMLLATASVALAGYALSRLAFRAKHRLAYAILLLQALPLSATMVPIYDLCRRLGLRNSYLGLILVHTAIALPFLIWLMKGFFDAVPRDLEEAAWLDGGSLFRVWWEIVLPVVRSGLAVVAGYAFLTAWAEVLMALVLIDTDAKRTVALAFYQAISTAAPQVVAAMGILYILPVLALFLAARRLLARGGIADSLLGM
jgi:ABC-type glycerol-3-phosphate transport system permease component